MGRPSLAQLALRLAPQLPSARRVRAAAPTSWDSTVAATRKAARRNVSLARRPSAAYREVSSSDPIGLGPPPHREPLSPPALERGGTGDALGRVRVQNRSFRALRTCRSSRRYALPLDRHDRQRTDAAGESSDGWSVSFRCVPDGRLQRPERRGTGCRFGIDSGLLLTGTRLGDRNGVPGASTASRPETATPRITRRHDGGCVFAEGRIDATSARSQRRNASAAPVARPPASRTSQ